MRWLGVPFVVLAGCSLLVSENIEGVPCEPEGAIGPPACDPGEVCAQQRCIECISVDVCGDAIDNDCSGEVDEGCAGASG